MKGVPHEFIKMVELGDITDQSSSGSEYTIQKWQANKREAKIKRRAIVYRRRTEEDQSLKRALEQLCGHEALLPPVQP